MEVGNPEVINGISEVPTAFALFQNYPNPFNPETSIRYQLPQPSWVRLKIFDLLGREVKTLVNSKKRTGYYEVVWDGRDNQGREVSSGIYIGTLKAGDFTTSIKMLLMK